MSDRTPVNRSFVNQQSYSSTYKHVEGEEPSKEVHVTRSAFRDGKKVYDEHKHGLNGKVQEHNTMGNIQDYDAVTHALQSPSLQLDKQRKDQLKDDSKTDDTDHNVRRLYSVGEEENTFLHKIGDMKVKDLLENTTNLITNTIAGSKDISAEQHKLTESSGSAISDGLRGDKTSTEVKTIVLNDVEKLFDAIDKGVISKNEFDRAAKDGQLWLFEIENKKNTTSKDIRDELKSGIDLSSSSNSFGGAPRFVNKDPYYEKGRHTVNLKRAADEGTMCAMKTEHAGDCPARESSNEKGTIRSTKIALKDVIRQGSASVQQDRAERSEMTKDAEKLVKKVEQHAKEIGGDTSKVVQKATTAVKDVAKDVGNIAKQAGSQVKDVAKDVGTMAKNAGSQVKEVAKEVAKDTKSVAKKVVKEVAKDTKSVANKAGETLKDVASQSKAIVQEGMENTGKALSDVKQEVQRIAETVAKNNLSKIREVEPAVTKNNYINIPANSIRGGNLTPELLARIEQIKTEIAKGEHFSEEEIRKYLLNPNMNIHDAHQKTELRKNESHILTSMAEEYMSRHEHTTDTDSENSGYSSCELTDDSDCISDDAESDSDY